MHCVMSSNITKELSQGMRRRADAVTQPCGEFVWLDEGDVHLLVLSPTSEHVEGGRNGQCMER